MLHGEPKQQGVERRAFLVREGLEELVLALAGHRAQAAQRLPALGGQADEMPAPVLGIATALHETALFELVEQPDELATVVAQRVCDRPLRLMAALADGDQDPMVVRVQSRLLVGRHGLVFRRVAEPLQEERCRGDELLREPRNRKWSCELRRCNSHVK
jgi:hypothetical protein